MTIVYLINRILTAFAVKNSGKMKIVIDEKIPFLQDALEAMGHSVLPLPGVEISKESLAGAGALFVRTRTRCDASLLDGTEVRFIGTATIGYDHIDSAYCAQKGIEWTNAAGCNADAVLQYVQAVVYSWARDNDVALPGLVLGIVGVGEIGSRIDRWARSEGMRTVLNDPPRAARGEQGFSPLAEIAAQCDIITLHPTLSKGGDYPSYHLADEAFFSSLSRCRLFINASRGPVVDNKALLKVLEGGSSMAAVLDVWEGEPQIDLSLLNKVYIATPHIAGYSAEGKINATRQVLVAFAAYCGGVAVPHLALQPPVPSFVEARSFADAALGIYSPHDDSRALKDNPAAFEEQRNNYKLRREPGAYDIKLLKTAE